MLKLGLFTFRDGYYRIDYLRDMFAFLCYILDLYTNRNDFIKLQSLDAIAQKDSAMNHYSQNNPIQKSAFDLKYTLLNKKNWSNSLRASIGSEGVIQADGSISDYSKVFLEIIEIFHFFMDLRQNFLMSNVVEIFHKRVCKHKKRSGLNFYQDEKDRQAAIKLMMKDYKKVLPNNFEFLQQTPNIFPSFDEMYENKQFIEYRRRVSNYDESNAMHSKFSMLLLDVFNISVNDEYLKQTSLTLICRHHSEQAEFIRNMSKMMVIFDQDEWHFYQWTNITIDKFTKNVEKSNLWLEENNSYGADMFIRKANKCLYSLKNALFYKYNLEYDRENDKYKFNFSHSERKTNQFCQSIYKNVKVYDHLINFIISNMSLLMKVRKADLSELKTEESKKSYNIKKLFRRCFNILEGFVSSNSENQDIMWKYKELFVIPELGNTEQDGELDLVAAIINNTEQISSAISLNTFINCLSKRMGNKENFVKLLEIYHRLMSHGEISSIKLSLIRLIFDSPEIVNAEQQKSRQEFEATTNILEILSNILETNELKYTRDAILSFFPLEEFITKVDSSIEALDNFVMTDENYDDQDYEKLRESQQLVLVNLYCNLYFTQRGDDHIDIVRIVEYFNEQLFFEYDCRIDKFLHEKDLSNTASYRVSEIKFLVVHLQILIKNLRQCIDYACERRMPGISQLIGLGLNNKVEESRTNMNTIEFKTRNLIDKLKACHNDAISEFISLFDDHDENEPTEGEKEDNESDTLQYEYTVSPLSRLLKRTQVASIRTRKKTGSMKFKNRRSKQAQGYNLAWEGYVKSVTQSRDIRSMIRKEQIKYSNMIYDTLTDECWSRDNLLDQYSVKIFISSVIEYV